ncbi:hypothetical protein SCLARK_001023 [Spiroplasma clarkii]|uniref:hypothetical protein n=1 Tax=Spiroplasma clarkii TaxID=2139 RepID=UPI000B57FCD4|nr:hypothetical protein [Spiroplasma clarkii]ARU91611.1 hypothetical protein SCLARK_001023 [Spiroplasma clarkii]
MAKKHGIEVPDFGLSSTIRRRIDELIDLNLSPTTINIFTREFSKIDTKTRDGIGRYIAKLLEIQNDGLEEHLKKAKAKNAGSTSKQEIILKQRKSNLLRIQRAFSTGVVNSQKDVQKNINETSTSLRNSALNVRNLMVTKGIDEPSEQEQQKEKLKELANKKRLIELAIFEEEQKQKLAQRQLTLAKENNDTKTQEIKLQVISDSKNKIKRIKDKVDEYDNISDFPLEILMEPDETVDFEHDEEKLRKYLAEKQNDSIKDLQEQAKKLNQNGLADESLDLDDFFYVEGNYECHYHEHKDLDDVEHQQLHQQEESENIEKILASDTEEDYLKKQMDSILADEPEINQVNTTEAIADVKDNQTIENPFDDLVQPDTKTTAPMQVFKNNIEEYDLDYDQPEADLWTKTSEIWLASDEKIIKENEKELAKLNEKEKELNLYFEKLNSAKKIVKNNLEASLQFDKNLDEKISEQSQKVAELSAVEEKQKIMQEYLEKLKQAKKIAKQNEKEVNELWARKEKKWLQRDEELLDSISEAEVKIEASDDKDLIIKKSKKFKS